MVDYLEEFSPSGADKGLPEDNILELLEFALLFEWQHHLLLKGLDPDTMIMNDIIKFCERLETSSYIFNYKGNASHPKNPISPLLATNRSLCQTMLHTNL